MKRTLKTVFTALLIGVMMLSLAACEKKHPTKKITTSTNKTKVKIEIGTDRTNIIDAFGEPSEIDYIEHFETYYIDGTQVYIYYDLDAEGNQIVSKVEVPDKK
ncbi:MAG: hypothetical protein K6A97_01200 [Lachnospiraceae bacterium]|nr:hypothetical protein [Lachnospiraceae bacterium]